MKNAFSILFTIVLTVQAFHLTLPYAFYGVAQDYIIDNFCVNKVQTEIMCSGKCYVVSLLENEASKGESNKIHFSIEKISLSPSEVTFPVFDTPSAFMAKSIALPSYHAVFKGLELILAILKPPIKF